jgi:hypothetical protein
MPQPNVCAQISSANKNLLPYLDLAGTGQADVTCNPKKENGSQLLHHKLALGIMAL